MSSLAPTDNQGLLRFLRRWYGAPKTPNVRLQESPEAPRELVEWHQVSAQWSGVITSHNYAIPLPELTAEDGKIPFWIENQGTWLWAFDPNGEDHHVYEREPSGEPNPWKRTGERLSEFLVHATVLEAILGAPATKVAQEVQVDWLWSQEGSCESPFPAWNWPARDSCILSGTNWLALIHPSDNLEAGHDIMLAAISAEDLAWAENAPGIKWRSYSGVQDYTTDEPLPW
ncbi:hypothetical protein B7755_036640 [Streptomyces sp. NBS 14/10]|uniref:hypothetical protein n=1 Tax=Streptomyces sp. NBS 14/10 TaxID=1945643 RepID=UPI00117FAC59|nr:hypothetical protein [Streptomyces sp. NBS 14/10]KAK1183179.1 hypothetical protein B7755_036640 [Streptomyces sp. NBS 14/10]